jgi:protein TonB
MMFSNLIESGSHAADLKRRGRYLLATTLFYGLLLAVTGVGSIYAYNVSLDYDPDYELVALMRFPPADARAEPRQQPRREQPRASAPNPGRAPRAITVTEVSMNTPYATRVASASTPTLRPNQAYTIGPVNAPELGGGPVGPKLGGSEHGTGPAVGPLVAEGGGGEGPPVLPTPTPTPSPAPRQSSAPLNLSTIISSKVIDKPAPPYPPVAKAAGVHGPVAVQILVDEQGRVVSAKATSGNPLLQSAAVQAAYKARFTPTLLGGQPVKVTGNITYNFVIR